MHVKTSAWQIDFSCEPEESFLLLKSGPRSGLKSIQKHVIESHKHVFTSENRYKYVLDRRELHQVGG